VRENEKGNFHDSLTNTDLNNQFEIHNAFSLLILLSRLMADYNTLFLLILTTLTFVIVGMFFIVYLLILGEREKNRQRAQMETFPETGTVECPHYFGYLSGYPLNEPIPDECFGCPKAIDCMNNQKQTETDSAVNEAAETEPPQQ